MIINKISGGGGTKLIGVEDTLKVVNKVANNGDFRSTEVETNITKVEDLQFKTRNILYLSGNKYIGYSYAEEKFFIFHIENNKVTKITFNGTIYKGLMEDKSTFIKINDNRVIFLTQVYSNGANNIMLIDISGDNITMRSQYNLGINGGYQGIVFDPNTIFFVGYRVDGQNYIKTIGISGNNLISKQDFNIKGTYGNLKAILLSNNRLFIMILDGSANYYAVIATLTQNGISNIGNYLSFKLKNNDWYGGTLKNTCFKINDNYIAFIADQSRKKPYILEVNYLKINNTTVTKENRYTTMYTNSQTSAAGPYNVFEQENAIYYIYKTSGQKLFKLEKNNNYVIPHKEVDVPMPEADYNQPAPITKDVFIFPVQRGRYFILDINNKIIGEYNKNYGVPCVASQKGEVGQTIKVVKAI